MSVLLRSHKSPCAFSNAAILDIFFLLHFTFMGQLTEQLYGIHLNLSPGHLILLSTGVMWLLLPFLPAHTVVAFRSTS